LAPPQITDIQAHNLCELALKQGVRTRLEQLALAQRLYDVYNSKAYEVEYGTWAAFMDHFAEVSVATASRLIAVHRDMVLGMQIEPEKIAKIGWSDAYTLLKKEGKGKDRDEVIGLIEHYAQFSSADRRAEQKKPGCDCDDCYEITLSQCRSCGRRTLIKSTE